MLTGTLINALNLKLFAQYQLGLYKNLYRYGKLGNRVKLGFGGGKSRKSHPEPSRQPYATTWGDGTEIANPSGGFA